MTRLRPLARIVPRAHQLLREVLRPGDLAVDLTAGNGHDTLFLYRCVGPRGRVLALDIQEAALQQTASRLREAGAPVWGPGEPENTAGERAGVHLIHDDHTRLERYLADPPRALIANLGYLPGSDRAVTTQPASTVTALNQSCRLLAPGGRLAVVVYVGHPGGRKEAEAVDALFSELPAARWDVLRLVAANRPGSPYLLVGQKR
jgi:predicted methyltransferase